MLWHLATQRHHQSWYRQCGANGALCSNTNDSCFGIFEMQIWFCPSCQGLKRQWTIFDKRNALSAATMENIGYIVDETHFPAHICGTIFKYIIFKHSVVSGPYTILFRHVQSWANVNAVWITIVQLWFKILIKITSTEHQPFCHKYRLNQLYVQSMLN